MAVYSVPMKPSTLRIGRRYRPNRLAPGYDALVIGSGMSGLTTAALLSDLGWRVCVLEQHYTAGGYTHSYERHGYEWDVGVHYIGDVGAKTRTRRMFDLSLIHISEPTRPPLLSRMPSSA